MKIKDYKFNHKITTISELNKYVGMPVRFSYYDTRRKERGELFAWIKEIAEEVDSPEEGNNSIKYCQVRGYNALVVKRNFDPVTEFLSDTDHTTPSVSNAQTHARTLTKEEFEMYRKKTLKRRMFKEIEI